MPASCRPHEQELAAVEADLALACRRILHARFLENLSEEPRELALFERAWQLYHGLGDVRGEGESLSWVGTFHQVVRQDNGEAVPALKRSQELATQAGDLLTLSYALRHLAIAEQAAGRLDAARERLEQSVRLRREVGFLPGLAANLVGLAYVAAEQGHRDEALAIMEQAHAIAETSGAYGIMRWSGKPAPSCRKTLPLLSRRGSPRRQRPRFGHNHGVARTHQRTPPAHAADERCASLSNSAWPPGQYGGYRSPS